MIRRTFFFLLLSNSAFYCMTVCAELLLRHRQRRRRRRHHHRLFLSLSFALISVHCVPREVKKVITLKFSVVLSFQPKSNHLRFQFNVYLSSMFTYTPSEYILLCYFFLRLMLPLTHSNTLGLCLST